MTDQVNGETGRNGVWLPEDCEFVALCFVVEPLGLYSVFISSTAGFTYYGHCPLCVGVGGFVWICACILFSNDSAVISDPEVTACKISSMMSLLAPTNS
jgi:hypothetical protein